MRIKDPDVIRLCPTCNKIINPRRKNGRKRRTKYCSSSCQHVALEKVKLCKVCGERIPLRKNNRRCRAMIYCSRDCYGLDHKERSAETKRKLRVATINYYNNIGGIKPMYNLKACEFFDEFDKIHNTSGQYATRGGEYHIKNLGYFLDYINFEAKLIIEWDEKSHYKKGKLRERDIKRQKEILDIFTDFNFIHIPESDMSIQKLLLLETCPLFSRATANEANLNHFQQLSLPIDLF